MGDRAFYRHYLLLAVPMILQNAITNLVSFLDNIMVGQLGTEQESLAAYDKCQQCIGYKRNQCTDYGSEHRDISARHNILLMYYCCVILPCEFTGYKMYSSSDGVDTVIQGNRQSVQYRIQCDDYKCHHEYRIAHYENNICCGFLFLHNDHLK